MIPASKRIRLSGNLGLRIPSRGSGLVVAKSNLSSVKPTLTLTPTLLHQLESTNSNLTTSNYSLSSHRLFSTPSSQAHIRFQSTSSPTSSPSPSTSSDPNLQIHPPWQLYRPDAISTKLPTPKPSDSPEYEEEERKSLEKLKLEELEQQGGKEAIKASTKRRRYATIPNYSLDSLEFPSNLTSQRAALDSISTETVSFDDLALSTSTSSIPNTLFSSKLQGKTISSVTTLSSNPLEEGLLNSTNDLNLPPITDTFYPTSKSVQDLAVLKGSLSANLIPRSHKLFSDLRRFSSNRLKELEKSTSIFTDSVWDQDDVTGELKDSLEGEGSEGVQNKGMRLSNRETANQIIEDHERSLLEIDAFERAYASPLDLVTYNLMAGAYLLKAANSDALDSNSNLGSTECASWFNLGWNLFKEMSLARSMREEVLRYKERKSNAVRNGQEFLESLPKNSSDPGINANSIATMALGLVRLQKWKSSSVSESSQIFGQETLSSASEAIVKAMLLNNIQAKDVVESSSLRHTPHLEETPSLTEHPSSSEVFHQLKLAATRLGQNDLAAEFSKEISRLEEDQVPSPLFTVEEEGRRVVLSEELNPVRTRSKNAILRLNENEELAARQSARRGPNGDIESVIPYNLINLKQNLSKVGEAQNLDAYERQKELELSALETAKESLQVGAEQLGDLNLAGQSALGSKELQGWMWNWYTALSEKLKTDLEVIGKRQKGLEQEAWEKDARTAEIKKEKSKLKNARRRKDYKKELEESVVEPVKTQEGAEGKSSMSPSPAEQALLVEQSIEHQIYPFLRLLAPSKLALITVLNLMRLEGGVTAADGVKTAMALLSIGRAVELEVQADVIRKSARTNPVIREAQKKMSKKGILDYQARRELKEAIAKCGDEEFIKNLPDWTQTLRARVGSYLVKHLMDTATVVRSARDRDGELWVEEQPAMYSSYQYLGGKKLGVIKLNEVVVEKLDKDSIFETIHPRHLPMLVPPKPWVKHDHGGYLNLKTHAMRFKDCLEQRDHLQQASDANELEIVLSGLDVLGQTPWRINERVFSVMSGAWNRGEGLAELPPIEIEEPEPERPDDFDTDIKARGVYLARLKAYNLNKVANHSQRCDTNYKLEIARAFLSERFYFPHNMDFRGRAYPIPPNLNHIGNDVCRGLMLFDDPKRLGAAGLKWLRIHIANLHGFDKASFAEREQFSIDNQDLIVDSAKNPIEGSKWWTKADDPWQCLSACYELNDALNHPEGPEEFESRLPVHQDGTCNGLQHYAALGGDLAGAKQVNLASGERPSDVYTGIADLVIEALKKEVQDGNPMAKLLEGKVTRKVVKQTVMTTVYGVTFIGAKNQVQRQLADRGDIPVEELFNLATYLARIIMNCIGDLFFGAEKIQDWLSETAKIISRSVAPDRLRYAIKENAKMATRENLEKERKIYEQMQQAELAEKEAENENQDQDEPLVRGENETETNFRKRRRSTRQQKDSLVSGRFRVGIKHNHVPKPNRQTLTRLEKEQMTSVIWTTPLGLPVVQPYRKPKKRQVHTSMQTVFIADPNSSSEVSPQKQASAFPPNFIHSLDATHMILTALECCQAGLTFASVHDSYWTHAADIETMSQLIRDTFVRLHEMPILHKLREEVSCRFQERDRLERDREVTSIGN